MIIQLLILFTALSNAVIIQNLDGQWLGHGYGYEFVARIPGGIYTDLMRAKLIDDIFIMYQDDVTKWVGRTNWTYSINFSASNLQSYPHVNLTFDGIDTFANVILNNITIGTTNNMFKKFTFDVKKLLNPQNNHLRIEFENAPEVGEYRNNQTTYRIPWECPPTVYHGECHINMLRKMQASFSWDWGPSFPSVGIFKPVYLEAYDDIVIRYVNVDIFDNSDGDTCQVVVNTYFETTSNQLVGQINVKLQLDHNEYISIYNDINVTDIKTTTVTFPVSNALMKLWWPNGYGDQNLYDVHVTFTTAHSTVTAHTRVGKRFVELIQTDLDVGATFYIKINGEPIFAKGSNQIPINILPELGQDKEKIRNLLDSAKEANMNMLRVWGGGLYESDYFYEVADELGIMIWQDFMFACSLYPANRDYLENVAEEVEYNIKRLYNHPSIVIYAGNNENEGVLADNWYNTSDNLTKYKEDYVALYIDTVKRQFDILTNGSSVFISSSPTNGKLTEKQGWVGDSPGNQYWGDIHYYNYLINPWDSRNLPIPRFCSEYGYQSYPFEASWRSVTNNSKDIDVTGQLFSWRQHHPLGNTEMSLLISEILQLPSRSSATYTAAFIYLSQVYSAEAIKIETEHYRRYRSYLTADGRGRTMGALYWQLNDVWVAPTWSSIDYTGRWKMLQYFAKNFFANIIVTAHFDVDNNLLLYAVNDHLTVIDDVTVRVQVYRYDSPKFQPIGEIQINTTLVPAASQLIDTIILKSYFEELNTTYQDSLLSFVILKESLIISPSNYIFPKNLKSSNLADAKVEISNVKLIGNSTFSVTVRTDNVALYVWLDSDTIHGRFSDNGFLQLEPERVVYFTSQTVTTTVNQLMATLTVTHLTDDRWN